MAGISRGGWIAIGVGLVGLAWNRYQSQQLAAKLITALRPDDPSGSMSTRVGNVPGGPGHFDGLTGLWIYDTLPSHDILPGDYIPTLIDPPAPAPMTDDPVFVNNPEPELFM